MDSNKPDEEPDQLGFSKKVQQLALKLAKNAGGLQQCTAADFDSCNDNELFTQTMRENVAMLKVCGTEIMRFLSCAVPAAQSLTLEELFDRVVDTNDVVLERVRSYLDARANTGEATSGASSNAVASPGNAEIFVVRKSGGLPGSSHNADDVSQMDDSMTVSKLDALSSPTVQRESREQTTANDSNASGIQMTPPASADRRRERSQMFFSSLIAAKNILRPQVAFRVRKPDNSLEPFRVALRSLPHATRSCELPLSEAYVHEISSFEPNTALLKPILPFEGLDSQVRQMSSTRLELVDKVDALRSLVAKLSTDYPYFTFDVEHHSYRSYLGLTCIIQISTPSFRFRQPRKLTKVELQALGNQSQVGDDRAKSNTIKAGEEFENCEPVDYIIDALALHDDLDMLNVATANPHTLKIAHSAHSDILWLQRDFSVFFVGLFDTQVAYDVLLAKRQRKAENQSSEVATPAAESVANVPHVRANVSLETLLKEYVPDVTLEKRFQFADWRIRPLPADLVEYARGDSHYLLQVFSRIKNDLNELEMRAVIDLSKNIAGKRYRKPGEELCMALDSNSADNAARKSSSLSTRVSLHNRSKYESGFLRKEALKLLSRFGRSRQPTPAQKRAVELLVVWRDRTAREQDESPHFVLPTHQLLKIAELLPRETSSILACCNPLPPLVRQHALELHQLILLARSSPANAADDSFSGDKRPPNTIDRLFGNRSTQRSNEDQTTQHEACAYGLLDSSTSAVKAQSNGSSPSKFNVPLKRHPDLCLDAEWLKPREFLSNQFAELEMVQPSESFSPETVKSGKQKKNKKVKKQQKQKMALKAEPGMKKGLKKQKKAANNEERSASSEQLSKTIQAKFAKRKSDDGVKNKKKKNKGNVGNRAQEGKKFK